MKITKQHVISFVIGLAAMFIMDAMFHFNPKKSQFEKDAQKGAKKIENFFKK